MNIYITDTETTGLTKQDEVIELALLRINEHDLESFLDYSSENFFIQRFKPSCPIAPEAQRVHNISFEDVKSSPSSKTLPNYFPEDITYLIGHNIKFDIRMLQQMGVNLDGVKPICTMELAKKYFPKTTGVKNYKLTSVCKHIYPMLENEINSTAHSAKGDIDLVLLLLDNFLDKVNFHWETLFKESGLGIIDSLKEKEKEKEGLYTIMPFGKYKGELLSEIPRNYFEWLLAQDLNEKLRKSIMEWM